MADKKPLADPIKYKPDEGFKNTTNILNEIRHNVIDNIRKLEGPKQVPSLCPVLFYIALPTSGCLHNLSDVTYKDLCLTPVINGFLHNLYHIIDRELDIDETKTKKIMKPIEKIWGHWLGFSCDNCLDPKIEGKKTEFQDCFDDLTKEYINIQYLKRNLNNIEESLKKEGKSLTQDGKAKIEQIIDLVNAREERKKAFNDLIAFLKKLVSDNSKEYIARIEKGIRSHPRHLKKKKIDALKNWQKLISSIKKEECGKKEILFILVDVFIDLAQEIETSKGYGRLNEVATQQFISRHDISSIELSDLVYYASEHNPWAGRLSEEEKKQYYPLYFLLYKFEQLFYGKKNEVKNIIYAPLRTFPNSGLIMGQMITINVDKPNLYAHIQALRRYEGRIAQAAILDMFSAIIEDVVRSKEKPLNLLAILGRHLLRLIPAVGIILVDEKIKFAVSRVGRAQSQTIEPENYVLEYDGKNRKKKDVLESFCEDKEEFEKILIDCVSRKKERVEKHFILSKIDDSNFSDGIFWVLIDKDTLSNLFHVIINDKGANKKNIPRSALFIRVSCELIDSNLRHNSGENEIEAISYNSGIFILFDREKEIVELAAQEIAITIANCLANANAKKIEFERGVAETSKEIKEFVELFGPILSRLRGLRDCAPNNDKKIVNKIYDVAEKIKKDLGEFTTPSIYNLNKIYKGVSRISHFDSSVSKDIGRIKKDIEKMKNLF